MLSHEFVNKILDAAAEFVQNGEQQPKHSQAELTPVEPELNDNTDTTTMVAPLQQKLELLKKAVDVSSYFDEGEPGFDPGPEEGFKTDRELEEIKRLAGVMHNAGDDNDVLDA